jgi:hypothetical protein
MRGFFPFDELRVRMTVVIVVVSVVMMLLKGESPGGYRGFLEVYLKDSRLWELTCHADLQDWSGFYAFWA